MRLIIAGGRTLNPGIGFIQGAIKLLHPYDLGPIEEVVCGGAGGIDSEGEHWAGHKNVLVKCFRADWNKHGKAAGPTRNRQMAEYADALLLIWDGESRGSASMKKEMKKLGKPVYQVILTSKP